MVTKPEDRFGVIQWLVCAIAAIGFAFDLYETLMTPLIVRPALSTLAHLGPGGDGFNLWVGLLLYVPVAVGGAAGLIGGYVTDLFGRRRVLVWSLLLYALATAASAYTSSLSVFFVTRCATWTGVCVEYVAAVTWLSELFPNPRQRQAVVGYTQAFFGLGGLMVTGTYYLAVTYAARLPAIHGGHDAWRYTMMSGVIPAVPVVCAWPWLPESSVWQARNAGGLTRPTLAELFQPRLRRTTVVAATVVACSYALPYGAIQHLPQIVPGLESVRALPGFRIEQTVSTVQLFQELGGFVGRLSLGAVVARVATQQRIVRMFIGPALVAFCGLFFFAATRNLTAVKIGAFAASMCFNGLLSFWGNYLPRMYPTHLRGTGEGFAVNIGGRVIGTSAALATAELSGVMPGASLSARVANSAGLVSVLACTACLVASFWLCEPIGETLPD
jgi:MFS family permease